MDSVQCNYAVLVDPGTDQEMIVERDLSFKKALTRCAFWSLRSDYGADIVRIREDGTWECV